ncbi:MAG: DNA helicase II [Rhodobacterales bacterium TMED271]|nr:MAG: DNA helicase II [Rhodobacterales bacterium TMED271]|tara:strand:- start:5494 stop:7719 length:2226 start_codon:yes stop_codon:yes gene_type:complete
MVDISYLGDLNSEQEKAVRQTEGPVLVLAGAGTGKTKALTARVAYLIKSLNVRSHSILAVTFTNKAANEMKFRIEEHIGNLSEGLKWIGTFHSICVKILRRHAEKVQLNSNFTIINTDDQIRLLRQVIKLEAIDEKKWPPRLLAYIIDQWKNKALTYQNIPEDDLQFDGKAKKLYAIYQSRLQTLNAVDFGDLILHVIEILKADNSLLLNYHNLFKYILVDEYQDTNMAQYLLLRLLAQGSKNICCVGDDDQSIYGWRGAEIGNILKFDKDFPGATVIRLEQNYRSTSNILGAASGLIESNQGRLGKTLWTDSNIGDKVKLIKHIDGKDEVSWICDDIHNQVRSENLKFSDIAILFRATWQFRDFEDLLLRRDIPHIIIGGTRFFDRQEIKDAVAYLRIINSDTDSLALERIINVPKRGIGEKSLQQLHNIARENNYSLLDATRHALKSNLLSKKIQENLGRFLDMLEIWRDVGFSSEKNHVDLVEQVLDESGYTDMLQNEQTPEAEGRLENLKELVSSLRDFSDLQSFLDHVSLVMENQVDRNPDKISLMTLHASKGLEFKQVYLPGWEEETFPNKKSLDDNGQIGLEEERRLAYVGITRAKLACTISSAESRYKFGDFNFNLESRFIKELPNQFIQDLTPSGFQSSNAINQSSFLEQESSFYRSPGWSRLQSNLTNNPSPFFNNSPHVTKTFSIGDRVFHEKFGYGIISELENDKALVDFEKADRKNIKTAFLTNEKEL